MNRRIAIGAILIIASHLVASGQLIGKFKDYHGSSIELKNDSTFRFEWHFDLQHQWAQGSWTTVKDTIYLRLVNIYDTLKRHGQPDTLVLSVDETANAINVNYDTLFWPPKPDSLVMSIDQRSTRVTWIEHIGTIFGLSQDAYHLPEILVRKGQRLYNIDNQRKLTRKRSRGIWPQKKWPFGYKKWPPRYYRVDKGTLHPIDHSSPRATNNEQRPLDFARGDE